jgi:hypothetical protein
MGAWEDSQATAAGLEVAALVDIAALGVPVQRVHPPVLVWVVEPEGEVKARSSPLVKLAAVAVSAHWAKALTVLGVPTPVSAEVVEAGLAARMGVTLRGRLHQTH